MLTVILVAALAQPVQQPGPPEGLQIAQVYHMQAQPMPNAGEQELDLGIWNQVYQNKKDAARKAALHRQKI